MTCEHCIDRTVPALVNIITDEISYLLLTEIYDVINGEVVFPPITTGQCEEVNNGVDCTDLNWINFLPCFIQIIGNAVGCLVTVGVDVMTIAAFNLLIHGLVEDQFPPLETCIELGYCSDNSTVNNFLL